jgi:hypothetical protein
VSNEFIFCFFEFCEWGTCEDSRILGYDAIASGKDVPTLQMTSFPPFNVSTLKIDAEYSSEASIFIY